MRERLALIHQRWVGWAPSYDSELMLLKVFEMAHEEGFQRGKCVRDDETRDTLRKEAEDETRGFRVALNKVKDELRALHREGEDSAHRAWNSALGAVHIWIDRHHLDVTPRRERAQVPVEEHDCYESECGSQFRRMESEIQRLTNELYDARKEGEEERAALVHIMLDIENWEADCSLPGETLRRIDKRVTAVLNREDTDCASPTKTTNEVGSAHVERVEGHADHLSPVRDVSGGVAGHVPGRARDGGRLHHEARSDGEGSGRGDRVSLDSGADAGGARRDSDRRVDADSSPVAEGQTARSASEMHALAGRWMSALKADPDKDRTMAAIVRDAIDHGPTAVGFLIDAACEEVRSDERAACIAIVKEVSFGVCPNACGGVAVGAIEARKGGA